MLLNLREWHCWLFHHSLEIIEILVPEVRLWRCRRCGTRWVIDDDLRRRLPLRVAKQRGIYRMWEDGR